MLEIEIKIRAKNGAQYGPGDKCAIICKETTYPVIITDISYSDMDFCYMVSADDIEEISDYCFYLGDIEDITDIDEDKVKSRE